MPEHHTAAEVRQTLKDEAEVAGGVSAWAKPRGFTPQYVSGVIGGTRPLSPRILAELGLTRVTLYLGKERPNGEEASQQRNRRAARA